MHIIPNIIPIITLNILSNSIASGINSKHTIAVINPAASDKISPKNFLDVFLKDTPIPPPSVVPNVPKNNPISVVFINPSNSNYPSFSICIILFNNF